MDEANLTEPEWDPRKGKWKIVLHTAGRQFMTDEMLDIAEGCAGKIGDTWGGPQKVLPGLNEGHAMLVDPDIYINGGPGSKYSFPNPQEAN